MKLICLHFTDLTRGLLLVFYIIDLIGERVVRINSYNFAMSPSVIDETQYSQYFNFRYLPSNCDSRTNFDDIYGVIVSLEFSVFVHAFGILPCPRNGPIILDVFLINETQNIVFDVPFEWIQWLFSRGLHFGVSPRRISTTIL